MDETLHIALRLASILAGIHRHGVIHKDLSPNNIVVTSDKRSIYIIDFELATTSAMELPSFTHETEIAGTLAYLAPELTGRMGRTTSISVPICTCWARCCTNSLRVGLRSATAMR